MPVLKCSHCRSAEFCQAGLDTIHCLNCGEETFFDGAKKVRPVEDE